ncbi:MAG: T9SS type A sorting domain-containing protein [Bacteroidales bacterium]|nr:T9SS type A sorting domain-containing protein [Bacteroidales bacterium]
MRTGFLLLLILLIGQSIDSYGQEILLDLQALPIKEVKITKTKLKVKSSSLLTMPFFDDFSKGLDYPDPDKWKNSYVFINQTYPINPPTIGVATFDAINQKGELYKYLSTTPQIADTLSSQPIDLNLSESDSVYFSFQYQPKGLGKAPQPNDSLVVEFLSNQDNKWIRVWSVSADFTNNVVREKHHLLKKVVTQKASDISKHFFNVMIPIKDERFLKAGFRLRFMNYASLPLNIQVPSLRGNGDHWHIDLVYINKNRSSADTLLRDISFSKPLKSLLKNYESIPWKHFNSVAKQSEFANPLTFDISYKNLGQEIWNVTRKYIITDQSEPSVPFLFSGGADNIIPLTVVDYSREFEYAFSSNWEDSAKFNMESYLITDVDDSTRYLRWNDTTRYTQKFLNYYAYDDGSAENGYGIYGEGSQTGMVAQKFHSYVEDSLKGVWIYFNRIYADTLLHYYPEQIPFKLTVWKDLNGKPGDTLYQKIGLKPIYLNGLNKFALYGVDRPLKIGGDFWVGWVNTTSDMLNVGFDLNNVHNDKLYYNLTGEWTKSQFEGSIMIRPVFGSLTHKPTIVEKPTTQGDFTIYPNPASNLINLNIDEDAKPELIRVFNLSGQVVISKLYQSNSVDLGNLSPGIYMFQLTFHNRTTNTKKLVIIK